MKSLGEILKEARELKGMTQYEVAKKLRYGSAQFVSNWERDISEPPLKDLKRLCRWYEIDLHMVKLMMYHNAVQRLKRKFFGPKKM